jgi:hypothetical protein
MRSLSLILAGLILPSLSLSVLAAPTPEEQACVQRVLLAYNLSDLKVERKVEDYVARAHQDANDPGGELKRYSFENMSEGMSGFAWVRTGTYNNGRPACELESAGKQLCKVARNRQLFCQPYLLIRKNGVTQGMHFPLVTGQI